jgi:phage tail sheath protein FI
MPVQVSYPGVYVEEVPSGVRTITGVSTSVGAFFGRASRGPINRALRILSFLDYTREFGEPHPKSDLAQTVRLFFENGGTDCYVVRLAKGAIAADVTLRALDDSANVLVATANAPGLSGNALRLEVDYNTPNPDETFNLRVIQEAEGLAVATEAFANLSMNPSSPRFAPSFVTQSSDLIDLKLHTDMGDPTATNPPSPINTETRSFDGFSQARRPLMSDPGLSDPGQLRTLLNNQFTGTGTPKRSKFDISVNDGPFVSVDLAAAPPIPNNPTLDDIANNIRDKINAALPRTHPPGSTVTCEWKELRDAANNTLGVLLTITSNSGNKSSVRVRRASSDDISAWFMLGVDQGGVDPVRWSNFRPKPNATFVKLGDRAQLRQRNTATLNAISALQQMEITEITIDDKEVLLTGPNSLETTDPAGTDRWFQNKQDPGSPTPPHSNNDGVREKLGIIAGAISGQAELPWRAEVWGYHLALIAEEGPLSTQPGTITTNRALDPIFDLSQINTTGWIKNVRQHPLVGGLDGEAPGVPEYLGNINDQSGLHALDPVDLFNLVVIAGDEEVDQATLSTVWGPISNYCAEHRAFLLIDPPATWSKDGRPEVVQNTALVNDLRIPVVDEYSAVFYPRLRYASNGLIKTIGPSGAIAGLMARIDSTRGVWKAPAGIEAELRGVLGLEVNLTDRENGVLNKLGVNSLRIFPNGVVNWGARTMAGSADSTSEWRYIPIRRLALFLEESLYRGTKWVVFEPNDEPLWAQIRLNLNAFMMGLFRQGAFQGSTPDRAFFVKCDGETTTQADRDLGIVNILVGFAPLKPAEFVVIKIQQIAGEL